MSQGGMGTNFSLTVTNPSAMIYDKPVAKWFVWLPDGSIVEDEWEKLPNGIVAVLVLYQIRPYNRVMYDALHYAKDGDAWGQSDNPFALTGVIKDGKLLPDDKWEEVRLQVHEIASLWQH